MDVTALSARTSIATEAATRDRTRIACNPSTLAQISLRLAEGPPQIAWLLGLQALVFSKTSARAYLLNLSISSAVNYFDQPGINRLPDGSSPHDR
jgi:hypothetical protein